VDEHSGIQGAEETVIRVKGMQCFYCFTIAANILKKYEGVKEVKIGLDSGEAKVVYCADKINSSQLIEALRNKGYIIELSNKNG